MVARLKLRGNGSGTWTALCGRAHPCPGSLGIVVPVDDPACPVTLDDTWVADAAAHAGEPRPAAWYLFHDDGYRRLDDGSYRILRDNRPTANGHRVGPRRGRRPLPFPGFEGLGRDVVGRFPEPPATVVCRHCGRRNVVPVPPRAV